MPQQIDTTGNGAPTVAAQEATQVAAIAGESAALSASATAAAARPAGPGTPDIVLTLKTITGATTLNIANNKNFDLTLTGNTTLTVKNAPVDSRTAINLIVRQDATGSRTLGFPTGTKWAGGTAVVASTAANAVDVFSLVTLDGGVTFFASGTKAYA